MSQGSLSDQGRAGDRPTLLVFNCHEAWVYQLGVLGFQLDIIVGLKGRYTAAWDEQMRPKPPHSRFIRLDEAVRSPTEYHCIIGHNISDLLDVKFRPEPRLLVIHSTLEGRHQEERSKVPPDQLRQMLHTYVDLVGAHVTAVSELKGRSWGFTEDIVPFYADPADYGPYSGHEASGLRVANFIDSKKQILLWDLHDKAFSGLPLRIVGHNPGWPGVQAARNWDQLKGCLQTHRFFVHTADPRLEDGYNMATLEAMAAGMPVLGNPHPTSPIESNVSGFLSDDPGELRASAVRLLEDRDLAVAMGRAARQRIIDGFSKEIFRQRFLRSIETARSKRAACLCRSRPEIAAAPGNDRLNRL